MTDHRLPRRAVLAGGAFAASGLPALAAQPTAPGATKTPAQPRTTYGDTPDLYPAPPPAPRAPAAPRYDAPSTAYSDRELAGAPRSGDGYETQGPPRPEYAPNYPAQRRAETYSRNEIVQGASDFLGVTAEAAGSAVERVFADNGRPTAYIAGEEGAGAFVAGLRYGKGLLYMKGRAPQTVYWQGPSVGWDFGGNGSRAFTLVYNLHYGDMVYRRFPGVEGSAYVIGGLGVNYQRADDITLAPIRAGFGLRLGANVGYLSYSRQRRWFPF